jgi:nucleolar protein 56
VEDNNDLAQSILDAAKMSMGQDISAQDMENVVTFAEKVIKLADFRRELHQYLVEKMNLVAPNLSALIGEMVGARLIAHAGSLTNLSKYPASTVQILGAEKALFRALKTKGNTPKYGLIYHSSFIGRAGARNKGRISRFLANKCSIASRIDSFSDSPTTVFGEALRRQVEERLEFYDTGKAPTKNVDAMKAALEKYGGDPSLVADIAMEDDDEESEEESPRVSHSFTWADDSRKRRRKRRKRIRRIRRRRRTRRRRRLWMQPRPCK